MRSLPTPERLRELLDYDPKTGLLMWKPRHLRFGGWNACYAGREAGWTRPNGLRTLKIGTRCYWAPLIIWAIVHGYWPEWVRHENGRLDDNRLENLSEAGSDVADEDLSPGGSGVSGVNWNKSAQRWISTIRVGGGVMHLGTFTDRTAAISARQAAEREHGFHG